MPEEAKTMNITRRQLRQIIKEEYSRMLSEDEEKALTRDDALNDVVKQNRGIGSTSGQGAHILAKMIEYGSASKGVIQGIVKAYGLKVTDAQKKVLGL